MSLEATKRAWAAASLLKGPQLLVLLRLADRANDDGESWPSIRSLAADTAQCERTVRDSLRILEQLGLISRKERLSAIGTDMSSIYRVEMVDFDRGQEMPPTRHYVPPRRHKAQATRQDIPDRGQEMPGEGAGDAPPYIESTNESSIESPKESTIAPASGPDGNGDEAMTDSNLELFPQEPATPKRSVRVDKKANRAAAIELLAELSAARKRVDSKCMVLKPVPGNLIHIESALVGHTPDDIRHVISVCEAQAKHDEMTRRYFDAVTPFRPSNIGRWLGMSLEQARKPRFVPRQAFSKVPQPMMHPGDDLSRMGEVNPDLCQICDRKQTEANPQSDCPGCQRPGCKTCCLPLCSECSVPLRKAFP